MPEHGHLRACAEGRTGELLRYGNVEIHGRVLRSALVRTAEIADYQVRQTPRGVELDVSAPWSDGERLAGRVAKALTDAGLEDPEVRVRVVDELDRNPQTGKLMRLVPLPELPGA